MNQGSQVLTGFKFKPNHIDIHFLSVDTTSGATSFSTDIKTATTFTTAGQATRAIYAELANFLPDSDYEWTPVLTNETGDEVGDIRPFFKVGTQPFKEQDLPHFLNIPD